MPTDVKTPDPVPAAAAPPAADAAPVRVLVVDDIEANREVLSRRLTRRGYVSVHAEDGQSALDRIAAEPFDLVLLDVMMPGMSGLEVLERVRQTRSATQLPIIMATAKDQSEDVVKALTLGANDYVTKPLDFAVLMARVQTQLLLKRSVQQVIDLQHRLAQRAAELERANEQLGEAYGRMNRDLEAAAKIQESYLPTQLPPTPGFEYAWTYEPCEQLAGDFLNVCPLGAGHVGAYVLDVSGHGVAAALLAVAAARALSPPPDPDSLLTRAPAPGAAGCPEPTPPAEVADRLNQKFNWDSNPGQFLTIFYVLLDAAAATATYVSAGHPGAILAGPNRPSELLAHAGLPIGVGDVYEHRTVHLAPGDRIVLYSDGVTESMNPADELFGTDRLTDVVRATLGQPAKDSVAAIKAALVAWRAGVPSRDDVSVLVIERRP